MKISNLEYRILHDGRTKTEIALQCGFANTRLSEYIHGAKDIPPLHLITLANVLKCRPNDLIGESDIESEMAW